MDLSLFRILSLFKNKRCMCSLVSISRVPGEVRVMEVRVKGLLAWGILQEEKIFGQGAHDHL